MWKEQFLNLTKGTHTLESAMKTQKQLEKQETKLMKAKTMQVFDINSSELKFGVKIQLSPSRAIYVANEKEIMSFETKKEAETQAIEVNKYLAENPQLESVFNDNKKLQVISF